MGGVSKSFVYKHVLCDNYVNVLQVLCVRLVWYMDEFCVCECVFCVFIYFCLCWVFVTA